MKKLKIIDFCTMNEETITKMFEGYMDYSRFEITRADKDHP